MALYLEKQRLFYLIDTHLYTQLFFLSPYFTLLRAEKEHLQKTHDFFIGGYALCGKRIIINNTPLPNFSQKTTFRLLKQLSGYWVVYLGIKLDILCKCIV